MITEVILCLVPIGSVTGVGIEVGYKISEDNKTRQMMVSR